MRISQAGIDLIKEYEGCKLEAYKCPAGVWTIGYGHTGPDVYKGRYIGPTMATMLLREDLERFEREVTAMLVIPVRQHQFDALVSFAFNLGSSALRKSTLLRKLNNGDYAGASAEFDKWTRAGGKVLPGLVRRRAAERKLFDSPVNVA